MAYILMTDSSCDLSPEMIRELDLQIVPLSVVIDGEAHTNDMDQSRYSVEEIYQMLRDGKHITTSAANVDQFQNAMRPFLEQGDDVLMLSFSSGLSATYSACEVAVAALQEEYPQRTVAAVDTKCASMGQGLLVYLAAQKKAQGASLEEVRQFAEDTKMQICHWFTVDDLFFLKRGGRVSAASAAIGSVLNIKPVLHVDNEGKLIPMSKVRGRKASLRAMAKKMEETAINPQDQIVFISHGDCLADAQDLANQVKTQLGVKEVVINYIGPVIGSHSGPGTVALFFLGNPR